jgi:integrase
VEWRVEVDKGTLRLRWTEPGGKRVARSLKLQNSRINRSIADGIAATIELEFRGTGTFDRTLKKYLEQPVEVTADSVSVVGAIETYIEGAIHLSKAQKSSNRSALKWAREFFAGQSIDAVTLTSAKQFRRYLEGKGLGGATVLKYLSNLSLAWDDAIERGDLPIVNPWPTAKKKIKIKQSQPQTPFSPAEVKKIIAGFREHCPHYADYVEFCLLIGCRLSEAIGLEWRNVAPDYTTVWIGSTLTRGDRRSAKSGAATIKLSPALAELFKRRHRGRGNELVFTSVKGGPISDGNFRSRYWKPMLSRLAIAYRYPYNSRHTYVSNALDQGASPAAIAAVTRHDTRTLFDRYAHQIGDAGVTDYLKD